MEGALEMVSALFDAFAPNNMTSDHAASSLDAEAKVALRVFNVIVLDRTANDVIAASAVDNSTFWGYSGERI